ncbi:unnamed protein product [Periconia digitata]|uniref:AMP-dependent synthetase/ligase domain-containing protein n=1 Tax=Periconia digitata TaxID=1303443 RepID=A0A9W4UG60_9PLEO|nr:unnamed protein product [Periconia digitata]
MPAKVGERLIAPTLDEYALSCPNQVFYSIPKHDNDLSQGFKNITCKQFSNAVNHAAAWLQTEVLSPNATPYEVIAYQGPNDLRYPILAIAASKVGQQILFPFPMAVTPIKLHLLNSTGCKYLLHVADDREEVSKLLVDNPQIQPTAVPELEAWLYSGDAPAYPYSKSWNEGKDDPWIIFHTSGTTGLPKPITYTNSMMSSFDVAQTLPEPKEMTQLGWCFNRRCYGVVPLSHFSGLCAALQGPLFLEMVSIQGPAGKVTTPQVISDILRYSQAEGFVGLPFLLQAMSKNQETLESLKALEFIQWIGAALDKETGDTLSKYVKLCPAMGTTECGPYFLRTNEDTEDWEYYAFQSGQGIEMIEKANNLYELVFQKKDDAIWQQAFKVFPDLDVFETKDLFEKHSSKDGLWLYAGRSDAIVVLSNSANINASRVEDKIAAHPRVIMALVGGTGRPNSFVIIELTPPASEDWKIKGTDAILADLWPTIEGANQDLSEYTRLRREFVIITGFDRGFAISPKGTIRRELSLKAFEKDISALFAGT